MAAYWPVPYAAAIVSPHCTTADRSLPSASRPPACSLFFAAQGLGLGSAKTWHLHINCATVQCREPGWPGPLSRVLVIMLGRKKDQQQLLEKLLWVPYGEGFTAANPNFLLSWPEWGGVGPDLTAEVLFFCMIGGVYREWISRLAGFFTEQ